MEVYKHVPKLKMLSGSYKISEIEIHNQTSFHMVLSLFHLGFPCRSSSLPSKENTILPTNRVLSWPQ